MDLPFSPSVQRLLSSFGDLSLLAGAFIIDPREKKKKSSQSYCQFASLLLRLLGSSDLRLQRFNYYFFFVSVHKTRPLNTEQSLPIAIVDNTVYNNESDGDN